MEMKVNTFYSLLIDIPDRSVLPERDRSSPTAESILTIVTLINTKGSMT
jgi:hypothetical protein